MYETLLDFYECERCLGDCLEDDLYLKKAEYGQIHRLVEIWQTFVNVLSATSFPVASFTTSFGTVVGSIC